MNFAHWSAAKSMNTILNFHSVFHFTAILSDRSCQCALSTSPIRNILRAKCIAVIVAATLITANFAEPVAKVYIYDRRDPVVAHGSSTLTCTCGILGSISKV